MPYNIIRRVEWIKVVANDEIKRLVNYINENELLNDLGKLSVKIKLPKTFIGKPTFIDEEDIMLSGAIGIISHTCKEPVPGAASYKLRHISLMRNNPDEVNIKY